jgi:hypothetical protein
MRTKLLALTLTGAMVAVSLIAFAQELQQPKEAGKDLWVPKSLNEAKGLNEAKTDSAADYQKFKMASESKIKENQMTIASLKTKESNDTKEVKDRYNKRVVALEQRNSDLEMKINGSGKVKTSEWSTFKREFNHDMNELGVAIKDVGVDSLN